jgi:hypothetical protein
LSCPDIRISLLPVGCECTSSSNLLLIVFVCALLLRSVNFWDIERYRGLATDEFSWVRGLSAF